MDFNFFVASVIFACIASLYYWVERRTMRRKFHDAHCCFCGLSGMGLFAAMECLRFVTSEEGRPLIESSAPTAGCVIAGILVVAIKAKSNIKRLAQEIE